MSVGCFLFQAGGLCFPSNSLSTNVNPSVSYNQLVSLLFPVYLFIFLIGIFPPQCDFFPAVCVLQKLSIQSAWFIKNLYSSAAACLVIPIFFA